MQKAIEKTTLMSLFSSAADMELAKATSLPSEVRARATGTVYRKQLFTYGTWINPNWWWDDELTMELTQELALAMKANFDNNTIGSKLTVPRNHTGDVNANTGEVIGMEVAPDALYVYLDVRDAKTAEDIDKGLIWDVSAGFDFDWVSQKDGSHHGPCLLHVALTDEPYINNMTGFEKTELSKREKVFAEQFAIDGKPGVIMMSKSKLKEINMLKLSTVKNDKDYPVKVTYKDDKENEVTIEVAAGAEVDVPETAAEAVTTQISESTAPAADGDGDDAEKPDETPAPAPAADEDKTKEELSKAHREIAEYRAEKAYDTLLAKGKIKPAQKELFMSVVANASITLSNELKLSDTVTLAKGTQDATSVATMLSAIFEAGPTLKTTEQGAEGEDDNGVKLSKEEREEAIRKGYDPEKIEAARQKRSKKE